MYCCYILSTQGGNYTYCGSTNSLSRRIRQHNGELKGGARYTTRRAGPWEPCIVVYGFPNRSQMLSFEWHVKHAIRVSGTPTWRRVRQVCHTLLNETRWWKQYPPCADKLFVYLSVAVAEHGMTSLAAITELPFGIQVVDVSPLDMPANAPSHPALNGLPQSTADHNVTVLGVIPINESIACEPSPKDSHGDPEGNTAKMADNVPGGSNSDLLSRLDEIARPV